MEGYHGTTPTAAQNILSTCSIDVIPFVITNDAGIVLGQNLPNDLGQGLYLFIDEESKGFSGKQSAKNYSKTYKHEENKIKILKFVFDDQNLTVLNLNNTSTVKMLNELKNQLYDRIYTQLSSAIKNNPRKKRANLDGIFLEFLIKFRFCDSIDCVICDTYTPVYNVGGVRTISNLPNGREICLRNLSLINWEKVEECE
ncbi:hypothetical protein [Streptococcus sanguinis]|uniref:hypothetical protein n=1 Tax=Streptococcus sanguinis TaxID=1305 RepID=UPI0003107B29|nr:hypothetical protein [Streptococcus sanguinis]